MLGGAITMPATASAQIAAYADATVLSISPAPAEVTEINGFVLTPAVATDVLTRNPSSPDEAQLYRNGDSYGEFIAEVANNQVILSLFNPITLAGEYEVIIPEGYLLLNGEPCPEQRFPGYTIAKKDIPQEIVVTPPAGTQINTLEVATIFWRGYDSVFIDQVNMDYDTTKVYFEFGNQQYPATANIEVTDEGTIYTFTPQQAFTGEGRLRLNIPADQILIDGENPSRAISYYWNLAPAEGGSLDIQPAPGKVKELGDFIIELPEAETIARGSGTVYDITLYRWDNDYEGYAILANYSARISQANKTITLTAGETFTVAGKYRLTIPNAYFMVDGKVIPQQNFDYEVDGTGSVAGISTEDGRYTVVTLDGKVVIENGDKDALNELENGIYVINGKKVVNKK